MTRCRTRPTWSTGSPCQPWPLSPAGGAACAAHEECMMAITQKTAVPLSPAVPGAAPSRDLVTTPGCPGAIVDAYHTLLASVVLALAPPAGGMAPVAALAAHADAARVGANLSLV